MLKIKFSLNQFFSPKRTAILNENKEDLKHLEEDINNLTEEELLEKLFAEIINLRALSKGNTLDILKHKEKFGNNQKSMKFFDFSSNDLVHKDNNTNLIFQDNINKKIIEEECEDAEEEYSRRRTEQLNSGNTGNNQQQQQKLSSSTNLVSSNSNNHINPILKKNNSSSRKDIPNANPSTSNNPNPKSSSSNNNISININTNNQFQGNNIININPPLRFSGLLSVSSGVERFDIENKESKK